MRLLTTAFFASGAIAAAVSGGYDCVRNHAAAMADDAGCGNPFAIQLCFTHLSLSDFSDLASCYIEAGCKGSEGRRLARNANERCEELFEQAPELKRRERVVLEDRAPVQTPAPRMASAPMFAGMHLFQPRAESGASCFTTSSVETEVCEITTRSGRTETGDCSTTEVPESSCKPQKTCSFDRSGTPICMDLENDLDLSGIIVAAIFGVGVLAAIASVTFLCCKDRRDQKKLKAKAEATALARAATKKKKAEQRQPLMRDQGGAPGQTDPFHDRHRG